MSERQSASALASVEPTTGPRRSSGMRRSLRLVLLVLSAVFVAVACYRLATRWESGKVNVSFAWLALSCLPMAAGCVIQAASWRWLMERMVHRSIPLRPTLQLHFESQMARYTPGKVGMPLVRMAGAERLGVPAAVAGYSVLTESISLVAMGGVVGFALLALTSGGASGMLAALGQLGVFGLGAFVLITLVLVLLDRRHYPSWLVSALHAEGTGPLVPLRAPFTHAAYWLTWAVHGYLAARAVGISSEHALAGSGLYVLAPIAGILALATPSGLGVREAVLSLGLSPFVGAAPAVAAALVSRAISLLVDVLMWLLGRALLR